MTEHVHEYAIELLEASRGGYLVNIYCHKKGCEKLLALDEAEARLNATERLSAEEAGMASAFIVPECNMEYAIVSCLEAYANILEGKDD